VTDRKVLDFKFKFFVLDETSRDCCIKICKTMSFLPYIHQSMRVANEVVTILVFDYFGFNSVLHCVRIKSGPLEHPS